MVQYCVLVGLLLTLAHVTTALTGPCIILRDQLTQEGFLRPAIDAVVDTVLYNAPACGVVISTNAAKGEVRSLVGSNDVSQLTNAWTWRSTYDEGPKQFVLLLVRPLNTYSFFDRTKLFTPCGQTTQTGTGRASLKMIMRAGLDYAQVIMREPTSPAFNHAIDFDSSRGTGCIFLNVQRPNSKRRLLHIHGSADLKQNTTDFDTPSTPSTEEPMDEKKALEIAAKAFNFLRTCANRKVQRASCTYKEKPLG